MSRSRVIHRSSSGPVVGGVNLAVAWGVGLIGLAIVLAVASLAGRKGAGR